MKKFAIVLGIFPGYFPGNNKKININDVEEKYQRLAGEIAEKEGVYVSSIMMLGKAIYPEQQGCPDGGESVVVIEGNHHPQFSEEQPWVKAVEQLALKLKETFQQHSITLEFMDVDFQYID